MPNLNDDQLDQLLSAVSLKKPPEDLTQRIMSALETPAEPSGFRGFLTAIFGTSGFIAPASGALASLMFGLSIGYLALPDLTDNTATEDTYLAALESSNWDTSFEDLLQ